MILNIRGTSGSGKTYATRSFKESCGEEIILRDEGKIIAHMVFYNLVPVYFVGKYDNVCGGCDTIHTQDEVCNRVRYFSQFGHVIFEGLLISHSFMRYYSLFEELKKVGIPSVVARLDTPLDVCLQRIVQRRLEKGNDKELNTKNTENGYNGTLHSCEQFERAGMPVRVIKHKKDPVAQISSILDEDKGITLLHNINIVGKF